MTERVKEKIFYSFYMMYRMDKKIHIINGDTYDHSFRLRS